MSTEDDTRLLTPAEHNDRIYFLKRNLAIGAPFGVLFWAIVMMAIWGLWFKMYDHNCLVNNYKIETRQRCPWSNECYDVQCAYVNVDYYEKDGKTHPSTVPVWYYTDSDSSACSKKSREWVDHNLAERYPIGTNQTCYSTYERHMGQSVWFTNMDAESMVYWTSISLFILSPITGIIGLIVLWLHRKKHPAHYEPIIWEGGP